MKHLIAIALLCPAVFAGAPVVAGGTSPRNRAATVRRLVASVSTDSLRNHIARLAYAGGDRSRVTFTRGNDSAAAYIRHTFESLPGLTSVENDTFAIPATPPWDQKKQINVIATMAGNSTPERVFLLGAHYDASASRMGNSLWTAFWSTIDAPGADDNATGVAALLEIARILSDPVSGYRGDVTLRLVAFASEESGPAHSGGHGGSRDYARNARARGEQIIGMVSVDMIGYNPAYFYTAIVSNPSSSWLGERFRAAADTAGVLLITDPPPFPQWTFSDHETFWSEGFDAICLIENAPPWNNGPYYAANPYYHTSYDSLGTVNIELVRRVTQAVLAMAVSITGTLTHAAESEQGPREITLHQNYPNPFNPVTTIRYELGGTGRVSLRVYDMLGREVRTLVDGIVGPGVHMARVDAEGLASGVYIYRLDAGGQRAQRTMHIIR